MIASIKLQYNVVKLFVHDLDVYSRFVSILKEKDFEIIRAFGKGTKRKEEAAYLLLTVLDQSYLELTEKLLIHEIRECTNHKPLFHMNSMATKAMDVLMREECGDVLRLSLAKALQEVHAFIHPFEIDPIRLTNDSNLATNLKNLLSLIDIVVNCIFGSADYFPK